jgi:hypothetical protein
MDSMRSACLSGSTVRLEFYPDMGGAYSLVSVDGDLVDHAPAYLDPAALAAVVKGAKCHFGGSDWMCTVGREADVIRFELWRDGAPRKEFDVTIREFNGALSSAFGITQRAYVA